MESFSTPQRSILPWVANVATVAVVMVAIGWSNGQRPTMPASQAVLAAPSMQNAVPAALTAKPQLPAAPQAIQAHWPAQTTAVAVEGLQAVGFTANNRR